MKNRTIFYQIKGNPFELAKIRFVGKRLESQEDRRRNCSITLSNFHEEQPCFNGPIHIDVIFYQTSHDAPSILSSFIKFVETAGVDSIFGPKYYVDSICAQRKIDPIPRIEFTISEV